MDTSEIFELEAMHGIACALVNLEKEKYDKVHNITPINVLTEELERRCILIGEYNLQSDEVLKELNRLDEYFKTDVCHIITRHLYAMDCIVVETKHSDWVEKIKDDTRQKILSIHKYKADRMLREIEEIEKNNDYFEKERGGK